MSIEPYSDLKLFISEFGADEFKPFAYYDKHLDCIRVRILDCSVIEERLSKIFTILKPAHSDLNHPAGFTIKGVRHLFESLGLEQEGVFKLADIIDRIVRVYPDTFVKTVQREFGEILEREKMQVEVDLGEPLVEAA